MLGYAIAFILGFITAVLAITAWCMAVAASHSKYGRPPEWEK